MDHWMSRSIWHIEKMIHWRTGTVSAWPIETILNQIRCVKSGNRSCAYSIGFKWQPTPCSIHVKDIHRYQKEIQNIWQRTPWNHSILERMETLHPRIRTHHHCIFWSQKTDILQNSSENEWQTSQMVTLPLGIWHQIDTSAMIENNSIQYTLIMTRSWNRWTNGRRRNDHVTRKHVYQPSGYRFIRKSIEQKRTGYRCEKHHGNVTTRGTYKSEEGFGRLENWRSWWKKDNILQRKELHS